MDPNEIVTLRYPKSGKIIQIKRSELPNYGLPLGYVSKIDSAAQSVKQGALTIKDVGEDYRIGVGEVLRKQGWIQPESTTSKAKAGVTISNTIGEVDENIKKKTGSPTALKVGTLLNFPAIGKALIRSNTDRKLADLETKYFLLVQGALTAVQGSRPSDYDIKSYMKSSGPSILNSPQVNEDRVRNLTNLMSSLGGGQTKGGRRPLSAFEE